MNCYSLSHDDVSTLETLLKDEASLEEIADMGGTPFVLALQRGYVKAVCYIMVQTT